MISRIRSSTRISICSVSSSRVPTGARTCGFISPVSTLERSPANGEGQHGADRKQQSKHAKREYPVMQHQVQHASVAGLKALKARSRWRSSLPRNPFRFFVARDRTPGGLRRVLGTSVGTAFGKGTYDDNMATLRPAPWA